MLAHTAYREAEVVVNTILGDVDEVNYDAIPNVIYTNPEVASVGHTEQSAKEAVLMLIQSLFQCVIVVVTWLKTKAEMESARFF